MTVWPNGKTTIPRVTDEFGPRPGKPVPGVSPFHRGIDLVGFAINCSPCDGVVIFAAYNGTAGNHISIRADNGDVFDIFHNASFLVRVGQRVSERQGVGIQGTTGASTGVHCHFECHPGGGVAVNPRVYMAAAIANMGTSIGDAQAQVKEAIMANGGALVRNNTLGYKFKGKETYGAVALVGLGFVNPQTSMDVVHALEPVYGPIINVTGDQYHTIIRESQTNRAGQPGVV